MKSSYECAGFKAENATNITSLEPRERNVNRMPQSKRELLLAIQNRYYHFCAAHNAIAIWCAIVTCF